MSSSPSEYTLMYWPGIPGRGEFIRLAFEFAKHPYKQDLNPKSFLKYMHDPLASGKGTPHAFSPPMLLHKDVLLTQTPNILLYISDTLGLSGSESTHKYYVNELVLSILDLNNEVHDTHHPVSVSAYYDDQKPESLRKAKSVREERIPKFLSYWAKVIENNGSGYLVGDKVTCADLCLFQVIDGCEFAFPKCMKRIQAEERYKPVFDLKKRIEEIPQVSEYLASERRAKYSNGVFRHYPELDDV
ncbi:hypothetical protein EMMF5_003609 [Cystobasidiomycetes sp. EMM_F5]